MGISRITTGSSVLDSLLRGGYESDVITTIYGPGGSGKTNLCILCSIEAVKRGKKVIYIDSEGGFSVSRLQQLNKDFKKILDNIFFLKPTDFDEQKKSFEKLKELVDDKIGLIVVDSISMLYRLELGKSEEVYSINRELGLQLSYLTNISRNKSIPVLITNQVYTSFDDRETINMVGGDILKYSSKCLIELQKLHKNKRRAILRKHRSLPESEEIVLEIREDGIFGVEDRQQKKD